MIDADCAISGREIKDPILCRESRTRPIPLCVSYIGDPTMYWVNTHDILSCRIKERERERAFSGGKRNIEHLEV